MAYFRPQHTTYFISSTVDKSGATVEFKTVYPSRRHTLFLGSYKFNHYSDKLYNNHHSQTISFYKIAKIG